MAFGFQVDKSSLPIIGLLVAQIVGGTVWVTKTDNRAAVMEQALSDTKHDVYKLRLDLQDMRVAIAVINGKLDTRERSVGGGGTSSP